MKCIVCQGASTELMCAVCARSCERATNAYTHVDLDLVEWAAKRARAVEAKKRTRLRRQLKAKIANLEEYIEGQKRRIECLRNPGF